MMIENEIKQYYADGLSAAEIRVKFDDDFRHVNDAYITGNKGRNLLLLLTSHGLIWQDNAQVWGGPLVDAAANDAEADAVMRQLYPYLQVNDSQVYCASSSIAGLMLHRLTDIVVNIAGEAGEQLREMVHTLTGGPRYAVWSVEKIQAAIDSLVIQERTASVRLVWGRHVADTFVGKMEMNDLPDVTRFCSALRACADEIEGV